ncbi:MAG: hypothetical protein WBA93_00125, partial [Microcoleaceae cyanobacterium]
MYKPSVKKYDLAKKLLSYAVSGFSEVAMRKLLLIAGSGVLALWISGCESLPFFNSGESSSANTPEVSPTPTVELPESSSPTPNLSNEPFPSPDIPQKSETAKDLIRSTDPSERTQSLKQQFQT